MKYNELIMEMVKPDDLEILASLCQRWLDGGLGMTRAECNTIINSSIARSCRTHPGGVIYRGIAPSRSRVKAYLKSGVIAFASKMPFVSYSLVQDSALAAADFTKWGDQISLVFQKEASASDILLDFTSLLVKLREVGAKFSHSSSDDEHELWVSTASKKFTTFSSDELVDADWDSINELESDW